MSCDTFIFFYFPPILFLVLLTSCAVSYFVLIIGFDKIETSSYLAKLAEEAGVDPEDCDKNAHYSTIGILCFMLVIAGVVCILSWMEARPVFSLSLSLVVLVVVADPL